ncbi:MAG: hypothetical protein M3179_05125 [Actinomycetota bacterium]|nr:hypothetical protein [Actinomycetota bacterium]
MGESRTEGRRRGSIVLVVVVAAAVLGALAQPAAQADVTAVQGSAMDYIANVSLFGGPFVERGPAGTIGCDPGGPNPGPGGTPTEACNITVELPADGGSDTADSVGATARYGPAIIFSHGGAQLNTQGSLGAGGSVTTTATINNINTSQGEVLTAQSAVSTCSASEAGGVTASTTITNGVVQTSEGNPDVDGDEVTVAVPTNPPVGLTIPGQIEGVGDSFEYIFNEQVTNPDGSITVHAAHLRLLGPTAVGDVFIGRSECGITATGGGTTTTGGGGNTTTTGGGGNTTTTGGGNTTTTGGANTTTTGGTGGGGVTQLSGGAYGFFTSISLFNGPKSDRGPDPTVNLPAGGSATPITASKPDAIAEYGPATIFSSGPLEVSTQGTTGANGSVRSSARVQNVNRSGEEVLTIADTTSNCTADATGETGSTRIVGGRLETSRGDPEVDGDETVVDLPADPAPNTSFNGTLEDVGDTFRVVLNEHVTSDGSITVNAAHMYLLGPTAVGDLIIGQSRCATTATGGGGGNNPGGGGTGAGSTTRTTARTGIAVLRWLQLALALVAIGWATHWSGQRRPFTPERPRGLP